MTRRTLSLLLIGYYGAHNAGDDLILEVIRRQVTSRLGPVEFLVPVQDEAALDPDDSLRPFHWLDLRALADAIERCDAVVVGGGGLFHDYGPTEPEWILSPLHHRVAFFAGVPWIARGVGKPVALLSLGVGPLEYPESRDLVRAATGDASLITVRDARSAEELVACGVLRERIELCADPGWLACPPGTRPAALGPETERWIGVSLRRWPGLDDAWYEGVAEGAAAVAASLGAGVLLVPFQHLASPREDDVGLARRLAERSWEVPFTVAPAGAPPMETMATLAHCQLVIAMRYHALLAALAAGRPAVALAYDPKVAALATDPDLDARPPVLDLRDASAEGILRAAEAALRRPGTGSGERLVLRAARAFDRLAEMLETRPILPRQSWAAVQLQLARDLVSRAGRARLSAAEVLREIADRRALPGVEPARTAQEAEPADSPDAIASRYLQRLLAVRNAAGSALVEAHAERRRLEAEATAWRQAVAEAKAVQHQLRVEADRAHNEADTLRQEVAALREAAERTRVELETWKRASDEARAEVEAWKRSYDNAREGIAYLQAQLDAWTSSKAGRLMSLYWRVRERLARKARRAEAGTKGQGAEPAAVDPPAAAEPAPAEGPPPQRPSWLPAELPTQTRGRYDLIVLSIIDWDFRFQRPQQIAAQFGRHGHRVFYLSTSSFLKPTDPRPAELIPKAPNVFETRIRSPRQLDIYGGSLSAEDIAVLADAMEELAEAACIGDAALAAQIPFWAPLAEELRRRRGWHVVYDCMDEWTNFPGFGEPVLALEDGLVASADLTVVSGETLEAKFRGRAQRLLLAKNAVDTEHYRRLYRENNLLAGLPHPIIGYFGALASWVDVPLLERIADEFPEATLVLAGGEFDVDLKPLRRRPNVKLLGQRPYEEMPQLLWHFDVCIIPFQINEITHATNPVKLYEYFYSGKPVVAPDLKELRPFADLCYLSDTHEGFLANLRAALAEPEDDPRREARRQVAATNDWSERYRAIDAELRETYPLVSVVVVTYNGWEHTERCLRSLFEEETWPRLEVIVVDNASADGTPDRLRELAAAERRLRVILNEANRGFAAANNQGMAAASGDVVVFLNNDTLVPPGLIGRLVHHLETDPTIGLLCPTTNFCGNEALVEPGYRTLDGLAPYASWRARAHRGKTIELSVAAMYCVAARREVLDTVGPLDEGYGLGMFEDDDYSLRVRQAGFRVVCAEDAYVHHVGQASFAALPPEEYQRIWQRNQEYFERKWGRPWTPHKPRPGVRPVRSRIGTASTPAAPSSSPSPTDGCREPATAAPLEEAPVHQQLDAAPRCDEAGDGRNENRDRTTARIVERWSHHLCHPAAFSPDVYWAAIPEVQRRLRRKLSAAGDRSWVEYCLQRHLGDRLPVEAMVSLGCGTGRLERRLARLGAFGRCDAFDITPEAVEEARRLALAEGIDTIRYQVADVETLELPPRAYDAAWFSGSLHHVSRLERVLGSVAASLKPDGYLFFFEYVGPSRFALGERQVQVIRAAFQLIPERLRRAHIPGYPHETLQAPQIPDPRQVEEADPSEAVRSGDIIAAVSERFEIVEKIDLGGTVLQFLLSGIAGNFRDDDPESLRVLRMLCHIEDVLISVGDLSSDFAVVVARPRTTARDRSP